MRREDGDAAGNFDLIVIGGGSAGSSIAAHAAQRGARVAMIEQWKVGGTCLNTGCDPTKTMVRAAEVLHLAREAGRFGLTVGEAAADWPALMRHVDGVIDTIRGGDGDANVRAGGVALFKDHGRLRSPTEVSVGRRRLVAERIVLATGAVNTTAPVDGLAEVGYITNDDAVALPRQPCSLAIIGAGPVAVEFAQIFARLGTEVTLLGSPTLVLPKEEPQLVDALTAVLRREGVRVETGLRITRAWSADGQKWLAGDREGEAIEVAAEEVMVATGRSPNVADLGLEEAGVAYSERGVEIDATLRTTAPTIWAAGDVTGIYPFTHVASYQSQLLQHNLFADDAPRKADYRVVPWVTFTDPELARVGLTESEARAGGYDVLSASQPFEAMPRAITEGACDGLVKLVVDRASMQVLGGHILSTRAGELIGEIALVMRHRLPVSALSDTIHPYPTRSEALFWAARSIGDRG
ncbi:MAG: FAD-dependent oxidoreductase [Chloroflexia bacterium]|nr:FAD-dependent oxidoreductase [Chloroflexia bacterium]